MSKQFFLSTSHIIIILSFRNTAGKVQEGMNTQVIWIELSYQFGLPSCLVTRSCL